MIILLIFFILEMFQLCHILSLHPYLYNKDNSSTDIKGLL